jgi:hypothetical protein
MGDNSLYLVEYFLKHEFQTSPSEEELIYFDFMGLFFVSYGWNTATMLYTSSLVITACFSLQSVLRYRHSKHRQWATLAILLNTLILVPLSFIFTISFPNLVAAWMRITGNGMKWFKREYYCVILFAPGAFLGKPLCAN